MAGRVAFSRRGWTDAIRYFTMLTSDTNCPAGLRVEAAFAYGDTLISQESTNKIADYEEAIRIFDNISQMPPTNRHTDLAWGRLAESYLQWAQSSHESDALTNAANAFQKVMASPRADIKSRSIAQVGLGVVFEAEAQNKTAGQDQLPLLKMALANYLQVFNGGHRREGETADAFWTMEAGSKAGRLAEKLEEWGQAIKVYQHLKELLPPLSASFENRIRKAQEHLPAVKID